MKIRIILSLLVVFFILGCKNGNLIVATSASFAPFEYMDGNEFKGIDIDIARYIAKELKMDLVIKNMEFDSVVPSIASSSVDIGISGLTVNETRKKVIDFTDPYFTAAQVVIFNDNDNRFTNIKTKNELIKIINDIKNIKIGVQTGTTGELYAKGDIDWSFEGIKNANVLSFSNGALAISAMVNKQVDIVIIDEVPAKVLVGSNKGTNLIPIPLTEETYAIGIRKNKKDLFNKVNVALRKMKSDGTLDMIIKKYHDL